MEGNKGAIHSIPAGAEHVHCSAGLQPPGQLCHCLIGARLFTAVPLASPSPKQTDAYDLLHTAAIVGHLKGFVRTWTSAVHRRALQLKGCYSQIGLS